MLFGPTSRTGARYNAVRVGWRWRANFALIGSAQEQSIWIAEVQSRCSAGSHFGPCAAGARFFTLYVLNRWGEQLLVYCSVL